MKYLKAALKYLGKEGSEVLAHSIGVDGQSYVVVISPGPKYRIPLLELEEAIRREAAVGYLESNRPDSGIWHTADDAYYELEGKPYHELQAIAKLNDVAANQSAEDIINALLENWLDIVLPDEERAQETDPRHPLYDLSYRQLQAAAKNFDIPANQSADDLIAALLKVSDKEEEGEEE